MLKIAFPCYKIMTHTQLAIDVKEIYFSLIFIF